MADKNIKLIANNKKAYHDYFVLDRIECGIALAGTEVKSLRMGKCSIKEAYVRIRRGEVFVYGMNISPYEKGNIFNRDPLRERKLLLHSSEIRKLEAQIAQDAYDVEMAIAVPYWSMVEQRDIQAMYNPMTSAQIYALYPNLHLDKYFAEMGIPDQERVIVGRDYHSRRKSGMRYSEWQPTRRKRC